MRNNEFSKDISGLREDGVKYLKYIPKKNVTLKIEIGPNNAKDINVHIYANDTYNDKVFVLDSYKKFKNFEIEFEKGAEYKIVVINKSSDTTYNSYLKLYSEDNNNNNDDDDDKSIFEIKNLRLTDGRYPGDDVGINFSVDLKSGHRAQDTCLELEYGYRNSHGISKLETKYYDVDYTSKSIDIDLGSLEYATGITIKATMVTQSYSGVHDPLSDTVVLRESLDTEQMKSLKCLTDNPQEGCYANFEVEFKHRFNIRSFSDPQYEDINIVLKDYSSGKEYTATYIGGNSVKFKVLCTEAGSAKLKASLYFGNKKQQRIIEYFRVKKAPEYAKAEFTENILKVLENDSKNIAVDFMKGCYNISANTIDGIIKAFDKKNQKHSVEYIAKTIAKHDLLMFGNYSKAIIEAIAAAPSIKTLARSLDINMNNKGVIGIVTDLATGGAVSVGGAIGIFADVHGNARILVTGSLGVGTTDVDVFPAVMYYPTMPSMDDLNGWGTNLDISVGKASVSAVFGEHLEIGVDILPILCSGEFNIVNNDVSKFFKLLNMNPPDIDMSLMVGYTKTVYGVDRN